MSEYDAEFPPEQAWKLIAIVIALFLTIFILGLVLTPLFN